MEKKVYYIENSSTLERILELLARKIPCFIEREYIEMNYSQIQIEARLEDFRTVENFLAPLV